MVTLIVAYCNKQILLTTVGIVIVFGLIWRSQLPFDVFIMINDQLKECILGFNGVGKLGL